MQTPKSKHLAELTLRNETPSVPKMCLSPKHAPDNTERISIASNNFPWQRKASRKQSPKTQVIVGTARQPDVHAIRNLDIIYSCYLKGDLPKQFSKNLVTFPTIVIRNTSKIGRIHFPKRLHIPPVTVYVTEQFLQTIVSVDGRDFVVSHDIKNRQMPYAQGYAWQ